MGALIILPHHDAEYSRVKLYAEIKIKYLQSFQYISRLIGFGNLNDHG